MATAKKSAASKAAPATPAVVAEKPAPAKKLASVKAAAPAKKGVAAKAVVARTEFATQTKLNPNVAWPFPTGTKP